MSDDQAATAGDDLSTDSTVSLTEPIVDEDVSDEEPSQEQEETEEEAELTKEEIKEKKKFEISQGKWQEMVEKSKDFDSFKENLAKSLGIETEDVEKSEDLMTKMQSEMSGLKELVTRKDWEADHPIVRTEKYKEAWEKLNADTKYSQLTYDEKLKLISVETPTKTHEDLKDQELGIGSVPSASKSQIDSGERQLSAAEISELQQLMPGRRYSQDQIKKMVS